MNPFKRSFIFLLLKAFLAPGVPDGLAQQRCALPDGFDKNAQYATAIYVSPRGSDSLGTGSKEKPFQTLSQAAKNAAPGTSINLSPGTHQAGAHLSHVNGAPGNPIRIIGEGAREEVVFFGGNTAIHLSDSNYLVLENFTVDGASGNGINIDDAGTFDTPAHHIALRNLVVKNIGPSGNRDGIKLSGLDQFRVEQCLIQNPGDGGSGIDMVGCHDGILTRNTFADIQNTGIQAKGGSSNILIYANRFESGGLRAINMGGSTGLAFFRPQNAPYEAARVSVIANIFKHCETPVAFVGCEYGLFAHNVIDRPSRWVARILQETVGERFVASRSNVFANNLIMLDDQFSSLVNIGPNTKPESFRFLNNLWTDEQNANLRLNLPGQSRGNLIAEKAVFVEEKTIPYLPSAGSAAIQAGIALREAIQDLPINAPDIGDWEGYCWDSPPTIGIYAASLFTGVYPWKTF